jgi:tripartite-type tricarboxylate transporter receptor subunit TctC
MKIIKSSVTLLLATLSSVAISQTSPDVAKLKPAGFPTQPIEFTVVYPAGGGMDLTTRLLAKFSEKVSGDKILVNNRTGGAGMVGHAYLATQAKPDGYTVGIIANLVWGDAILRGEGKWSLSDIETIAYINSDALTWVSSTKGPFKGKTAKEIIQTAKEKPGTVRVAVVPGSMWEYLVDQIEQKTGAKFLRVPFQGGKPGIVAMLGDNVDVAQGFYGEFQSFMDAGDVTPIAVASSSRTSNLNNVPTFNEIYNTNDIVWNIIRFAVVPKGTPADRKAYLAAIISTAVKDPELVQDFAKLGAYFDPSLIKSSAIAKDINDMAMRERNFYITTGRLKQ